MPLEEKTVRIAGLCGSLRPGSYTKMAVKAALNAAVSPFCETELIDLLDFNLFFADGRSEKGGVMPEIRRFRERLRSADGFIIGTPEYHGSFTGVLKNALDHTGFAEWEGKMIALIGVSGGRMGAFNALNSLRDIGRSLHAGQVCVADGTDLAGQKIARVLSNDPGLGVLRHIDSGDAPGGQDTLNAHASGGVRLPS